MNFTYEQAYDRSLKTIDAFSQLGITYSKADPSLFIMHTIRCEYLLLFTMPKMDY